MSRPTDLSGAHLTIEDAIAWCEAREVSLIFRANGTMPRSVVVLVHGSPVKAEKASLVEAVAEASRRLMSIEAQLKALAEERARRKVASAGSANVRVPDIRIP